MLSLVKETKICSQCSKELPATIDHFYRGSGRGGLLAECKACCSIRTKNRIDARKQDPAEAEKLRLNARLRSERYSRKNGVQPRKTIGPTKICSRCKQEKDRCQDFYSVTRGKNRITTGHCKSCAAENQRSRDWAKRLVEQTKSRHTKRWSQGFDLTPEYLHEVLEKQGGRCAWLGVELRTRLGGSFRYPDQVSLDRIDNAQGYTKANTMLVCQAANLARCDAPVEVFEDFVRSIKGAR